MQILQKIYGTLFICVTLYYTCSLLFPFVAYLVLISCTFCFVKVVPHPTSLSNPFAFEIRMKSLVKWDL